MFIVYQKKKFHVYFKFIELTRQNDAPQNKPDVRVVRYNPPCDSRALRVSRVFLDCFYIPCCRGSNSDVVCALLVLDLSVLPQLWFRCRMAVYTQAKLQR